MWYIYVAHSNLRAHRVGSYYIPVRTKYIGPKCPNVVHSHDSNGHNIIIKVATPTYIINAQHRCNDTSPPWFN